MLMMMKKDKIMKAKGVTKKINCLKSQSGSAKRTWCTTEKKHIQQEVAMTRLSNPSSVLN